MRERTTVAADETVTEAVGTTGLFALVAAVIAVAFALASFGVGYGGMAAAAGLTALVSFGVAILCFSTDCRMLAEREQLAALSGQPALQTES